MRRRVAPILDDLLQEPDWQAFYFRPRRRRETVELLAEDPDELFERLEARFAIERSMEPGQTFFRSASASSFVWNSHGFVSRKTSVAMKSTASSSKSSTAFVAAPSTGFTDSG